MALLQKPDRNIKAILWMIGILIAVLLIFVVFLVVKSLEAAPFPEVTSTAPGIVLISTNTIETTSLPVFQTLTPTFIAIQQNTITMQPTAFPSITITSTLTPSSVAINGPPVCNSLGQTWVRPVDKMVMVCIPGGNFQMGLEKCNFAGCEKEVNGGNINLPGYWVDRTEVTNRMFQKFVDQTNYVTGPEKTGASEVYGLLAAVSGANWRSPQGPGSTIFDRLNHPVVQMNWYSANAYCKWAGGQLPSEAEWEKAARGSDGRLWPWGNALPSDKLMNAADKNVPAEQSRLDQNDGFRYTAPVGFFPAGQSPYGLMDMAGNAWEWTRSILKPYPYQTNDGREVTDLPGPGDNLVLRGGCWFDDYGSLRSTMRYGGIPDLATDGTGFRCEFP